MEQNSTSEPLYLEVDLKASFAKLAAWIKDYNCKMKQFHPQDWRKYSLKISHRQTAEKFIYAYYTHALKNKVHRRPDDLWFWLTSGLMEELTGGSNATYHRHVDRLKSAGFFYSKTFRGTNSATRYVLNPTILVAKIAIQDLEKILKKQGFAAPSFSAGSTALKSVCDHTLTSGIPQEAKKIKDDDAVLGKTDSSDQTGVSISFPQSANDTGGNGHKRRDVLDQCKPGSQEGSQDAIPGGAGGISSPNQPKATGEVARYIPRCLKFMLYVLYQGKEFEESEITAATAWIRMYFDDTKQKPLVSYLDFLARILLKRYAMDAKVRKKENGLLPLDKPLPFIPKPSIWLNPIHSWGFAWTKDSLLEVRKRQAKEPDYYANLEKFAIVYHAFAANPSVDNYHKAQTQLMKIKDKGKILDMFYSTVGKPEEFINFLNKYNKNGN